MAWFNFNKKGRVIDLSKHLEEKRREEENLRNEEVSGGTGIEDKDEKNKEDDKVIDLTDVDEKKKNFAKRILDITEKLDSISTKLYHLEQRIEVLEKKLRVNNFDKE